MELSLNIKINLVARMLFLVYFIESVVAVNFATYPSVPKTASINGFADPLMEKLPLCAHLCVKMSVKSTPCPYWDTGCFCVMPQWLGVVGSCIAKQCKGKDVASATSLAYSLCEKVGANVWMMPASVSTELSSAAGTYQVAAATTKDSGWTYTGKVDKLTKSASLLKSKAEKSSSSEDSKSSSSSSSSSKDSSSGSGGSLTSSNFFAMVSLFFLSLLS